jgi:hypothetical protein
MSARELLGDLLLGATDAPLDAVERDIDARLRALGDVSALDEDDPRTLLAFLLAMARHELRFPPEPVSETLCGELAARLARRPREEVEHAQLFIDPASTVRRAALVARVLREHGGACLAVGDDDALSLALLAMGHDEGLTAVDIDERLLSFLEAEARSMDTSLRTHVADVHEDEPSPELLDAFTVVVTDPPRSFDEAIAFIGYSARCLTPHPESRLFYADHADWNLELAEVLRELPGLGLEVVARHESAARYPLTPSWVPDLPTRARVLGVDVAWLRALIAAVPAHSDLFELRPRIS